MIRLNLPNIERKFGDDSLFPSSGYIYKEILKEASTRSEMYGVTNQEINNYNTHIAQYSRSKDNQIVKFDRLIEYNLRNI